ncbi:Wzz/FepE/Etk N-terminal domain-containing protein [Sagittula salina]|uniref:Chain-length determining protein n=1 Tax=Sagittula salina TaxID=2820268 RepID=A0A940S2Q7_9RHOB|nr:Wzz/FepE/Etk N-terminal domain-containing protein [Sagittula salina]MBP0484326.1 chain-length determining protein [Sagittula salina]
MNQFHSIGEILAAVKRRGWLILAIVLIGTVLSLNYALTQTKIFEATAVVQIEDARVSGTQASAIAQVNDTTRRLQLIEQRLMSRDNLMKLMDEHALFGDAMLSDGERLYRMRKAARIESISNPQPMFSAVQQAPSGLMITVQLADPEKAATVANDLMTDVIEQSRDRSEVKARETLAFYQAEEARVDREISRLEDEIAAYKLAHAEQLPAGVAALRTELATLRDSALALEQDIIGLQADSSRKRAEDVTRQLSLLQDQKALVTERAAQTEALINGAPTVERELTRMEREMDRLKDQYSVITRGKAEAEMGQALQDQQAGGRFEVLETALVPENPMSSSARKIAGVGAVGSLILALLAALVVEMMHPAIRTEAQMERLLGIQPVVTIPVVATKADRSIGGVKTLGKVLGLTALLAGLVAWLGKTSGLSVLVGDLLPRRVVAGE